MDNNSTAIYVRVSTEEQALHGFSVRAQIEKLTYYAENIKNWFIFDKYIDEGISGKDIVGRPAIKRMLNDIMDGKINNVLVYKIDRLTRSTKDLIELIDVFNKYNCEFNSLCESIDTSTATGRMFIKIIGIFAEFERENIVERVKLGFERKAKEGYSICSSTPPFGYDRPKGCKNLIINRSESKVVQLIFRKFLMMNDIKPIVEYLEKNKIKTKKNRSWSHKTVRLILSNPTYIGKIRYGINKKNYFESRGNHPAIINIEDYYTAQEKLKDLTKKKILDAYFTNIIMCSCGNFMITKRIYKKNKQGISKVYINYRCPIKKEDCSKDISHNKLDKYLSNIYNEWSNMNLREKREFLIKNDIKLELKENGLIASK